MRKRKPRILYVLHVSNKNTGLLLRVLTYKNQTKALNDLAFYNSTLNLMATLDTVYDS